MEASAGGGVGPTARASTLVGRSGRLALEAPTAAERLAIEAPPPAGVPPSAAAAAAAAAAAPLSRARRGVWGMGGTPRGGRPPPTPPARGGNVGGATHPPKGCAGSMAAARLRRRSEPSSAPPPRPPLPPAAPSPAASPPVAPLDWEDDRRSSMALRTPSDYDGLLAPNSIGRRVTVVARGTGFPVAVDGAHERLRRRQMDAKLDAAAVARQPLSPVVAPPPPPGLALSPSSMTPWAAADAWPDAAAAAAAAVPASAPPSPRCTSPSSTAMTGSSVTASPAPSTPPSPTVASRWPSRRSAALGGGGEEPPPAPRAAASDRRVSLPGDLLRRPFSTSPRPASARAPSTPAADEWLDEYVSFASEAMVRSAAPARGRVTTVSGRTASSMAMRVRRRRSIWGRRRPVEVAL